MRQPSWSALFARQSKTLARALQPLRAQRRPPAGSGDWLAGMVADASGVHRYRLFRPAGVKFGERLPLLVMLHGCHQDAKSFAAGTRMNTIAAKERFLVLYPEQARLANGQGCWNWFDPGATGRAAGEAAWILHAIDKVCVQYLADRARVAIAGLSAGAGMAALVATRYPARVQAVVMHSGVPPGVADSTLSALRAMRGTRGRRADAAPLPPPAASSPWPPLLVIHGDGDGVVAPGNARTAAQMWAQAAGARASAPRTLQRGRRYPMQVTDFDRAGRRVCTLVQVAQLGHAWSGGAAGERFADPRGPDASRMAWAFIAKCLAARPAAAPAGTA